MAILDVIKNKVQNAISVEVQPAQNGQYPVIVRDTSQSITANWSLVYRASKSQYNNELYCPVGRFVELHIPNFSHLYSQIQQVYAAFINGQNVEVHYGTNFATYPVNDQLWFTAIQRPNSVGITMTITDENSPFHMLSITYSIINSRNNGQPYLVGYDQGYDSNTDIYVERFNASMLPAKKRFVPVRRDQNTNKYTIKANGFINQQGLVEINENNTEVVYIQEIGNERRLLASIYEKMIMEIALEKASTMIQSQVSNQPQQSSNNGFAFSNPLQQSNWSLNPSMNSAQPIGAFQSQSKPANAQSNQNAFMQPNNNAFPQQNAGSFNMQSNPEKSSVNDFEALGVSTEGLY